jgi:tRNA(Ile2)-agmatinylcytidine synthase
MKLWVGIDDTDSPQGMCTTYLAVLIIKELEERGLSITGFPRLIRLNPTIPFKTRGNGAVSFMVESDSYDVVKDVVDSVIRRNAMLDHDSTNPGAVFVNPDDDAAIDSLFRFSQRALKEIVMIDEAKSAIKEHKIEYLEYKTGRGLIGALAAVGIHLNDFTLEKIAYRSPERFGTEREIDEEAFYTADLQTYPDTWDTVDWHNRVVVSVPNSPDPVLFGIRGDNISAIDEAFGMIESEPFDFQMTFVTNQGTDMHLIDESEVRELKNYHSYILKGEVVKKPFIEEGGHVFFFIRTRFGVVKCSAFEPTKQFRNIITELVEDDLLKVYGSMKKDTVNLEKIHILKLADILVEENPLCPSCGKRMESAGKNQGFRCRKCKTKSYEKVIRKLKREIEEGFYEVPPCARRHISKPLVRMDVENKHIFR